MSDGFAVKDNKWFYDQKKKKKKKIGSHSTYNGIPFTQKAAHVGPSSHAQIRINVSSILLSLFGSDREIWVS